MKKKMKALVAMMMATVVCSTVTAGATTYEQASKAFKLDTRSYTMAPGNIYDFKVTLKGDLTQKDVKVTDSRTGSVVKMTPVKNTDKYRVTAAKEGTTYITAEVGGAHLSFKVDVKKGVKQGGAAASSNYAVVPDNYQPVKNSSPTAQNPNEKYLSKTKPASAYMYPDYARAFNTEVIIQDMIAEGKRLGMVYNPDFKITKIIDIESGAVEVSGGAGYWMPGTTLDYTIEDPNDYDNSYWLRKNCLEAVQSVCQTGIELAGAKPSDIRFNPVLLSQGNGEYYFYVFYG